MIFHMKTLINYVNEGQISPPDTIVSYLSPSYVIGPVMDIYWPLISGGGTIHFAKPYALIVGSVE